MVKRIPERNASKIINYSWSSTRDIDLAPDVGQHRVNINVPGNPKAVKARSFRMRAGTGPQGADLICDIHKDGGGSLWSAGNRPKIRDGEEDSGEIIAFDDDVLTQGGYVIFDIDQVGSTVAGQNLTADFAVEVQY